MKQLREIRRSCTRDNVEADESYLIHIYNMNTNREKKKEKKERKKQLYYS